MKHLQYIYELKKGKKGKKGIKKETPKSTFYLE